MRMNFSGAGGYSIFKAGATASVFCWDFLAAAMARQIGQGCSPSKVCETASETVCVQRLPASIVVHATVCSAAQCRPVVKTSATTTRNFPQRANTGARFRESSTKSRFHAVPRCCCASATQFIFPQSKPACRSAADRTAKSNPHRQDGCSRATPAGRWKPGRRCRGCKYNGRGCPHRRPG